MHRRLLAWVIVVLLPGTLFANENDHPELRDIFFGEILYHSFLDDYFEAIVKLDTELGQFKAVDEPELDPFSFHQGQAEFAVGDIELSYRMFLRAGRAIKTVLGSNVDQKTRNKAAYRLAKLYFTREDFINALHALELIEGEVPDDIKVDEPMLRAQVLIANGQFTKAAEILRQLKSIDSVKAYAGYNLAIALMGMGNEEEALVEMAAVGNTASSVRDVHALKDKANLTLGYRLLENNNPAEARKHFSRVRLDGPFSNRALLGAGWAEATLGKFDRALVAWNILHEREQTDESVHESMMAVPYAYSKLDVHGTAALKYGRAMEVFGQEIDKLEASITSIREGKFLKSLLRKEGETDINWFVNLRNEPDTPETYYIMLLMASHDFQEAYKNYKDLSKLRKGISYWLSSLDVYVEMIDIRRAYYEPILPEVEEQFKRVDSRMKLRVEQRDRLNDRIQSMLVSRRPEYLAKAYERSIQDQLASIELVLDAEPGQRTQKITDRIERLKGVISYTLATEYDERLTEAYKHLQELDEHIFKLNGVYQSYIRTRQAATQSYEGYGNQINHLRVQLLDAQRKLEGVMARQGRLLENLAINELERRRNKLEDYQIKARFALAESYDRATKAQQKKAAEEALNKVNQKAAEKEAAKQAVEQNPEKAPEAEQAPEQVPEAEPKQPATEAPSESVDSSTEASGDSASESSTEEVSQ